MFIQPNSRSSQVVAGVVLGGITLAGMYFNATYASTLGHDLIEKVALGTVSVMFDAGKVLAFCYMAHHLCRLSFLRAAMAGAIWLLTASFAMYAAGSFVFSQLAVSVQQQEQTNKEIDGRTSQIARLDADLAAAKLALNSKGKPMFQSSGSCLQPTTPESEAYCNRYLIALGTVNELREKASKDNRIRQEATPAIAEWSRLTGLSVKQVMIAISLIFAGIMELVASVSGFAFAKNARDIQDEVEAETRRRKHERHMAQIQAARERNERRNAKQRERRAERRPALAIVR